MKSKNNSFLRIAAMLALGTSAQATPYYWDNTSPIETSGFGTAGGTWGTEAKWSTSSTGDVTPGFSGSTTISDDLFFGTDTATFGLADGTVTVNGTVDARNLTFGSQSGGITLSGGTAINLAATSTITVNNASDTISTTITGATTLNKAGSGTLILGHPTDTLPNAVALNISAGKLDFGANSDTIGIVGMTGGQIGGTSGTLTATRVNVDSTTTAEMTGGNIIPVARRPAAWLWVATPQRPSRSPAAHLLPTALILTPPLLITHPSSETALATERSLSTVARMWATAY